VFIDGHTKRCKFRTKSHYLVPMIRATLNVTIHIFLRGLTMLG